MKNHSLKLRHLGLLAAFILLTGSLQAQSKLENLLNKMAENNKMTTVTISKEMLSGMMNMAPMNSDSTQKKDMQKMADDIGYMRIVSSDELTPEEQISYNKMITDLLSTGYKDYMNVSSKEHGKSTNVRMCVKPIDKDNISEFIIYVREDQKLSLIAIVGKLNKDKMMELTKLSNLKGMVNQSMKNAF